MDEVYKYVIVFFASLLGSTHCVSMCGGFSCLVASSCGAKKNSIYSSLYSLSIYHIGRLITYSFMSYLFFTFGEYIKYISGYYWTSGILLLIMIIIFLLSSTSNFFIRSGLPNVNNSKSNYSFSFFSFFKRIFATAIKKASLRTSALNSLCIGLLSTTIPCGWLYLNIALAGAEPKIEKVFIHIFCFWLGTIPLLTVTGFFANKIIGKFSTKNKIIGYFIITLLSFYSIYIHFSGLTPNDTIDGEKSSETHSCH